MLSILVCVCITPAVFGIIVRDPPPSPSDYRYSYSVDEPRTGDSKSLHEERLGDVVTGAYSVVGPDGTKRVVEYKADASHGFTAVLREEPMEAPAPTGAQESAMYFTPDVKLQPRLDFDGRYFIPANLLLGLNRRPVVF